MVGVCEDNARAQLFQRALRKSLDGSRGSHRHKSRRLKRAMRRSQSPAARARRIRLQNLKRKIHTLTVPQRSCVAQGGVRAALRLFRAVTASPKATRFPPKTAARV